MEEVHLIAALLFIFVATGVFIPLLIVEISINGGCARETLLIILPNSIGMCFPILFAPDFSGVVRWRTLFLAGFIEACSQVLVMNGLLMAGSALYTVSYSSVTIFTAIFASCFLHNRLTIIQWVGVVIVVCGLTLVTVGAGDEGKLISYGIVLILIGAAMHSMNYILCEHMLSHQQSPVRPTYLSFLLGLVSLSLNLLWQLFYTYPRRQRLIYDSITAANGNGNVIAICYAFLTAFAAAHAYCFFNLLGSVGSTTTGLCKAAQSVLTFCLSHILFCSVQDSQCFTTGKGLSLVVVLCGVLLYSFFGERSPHKYASIGDVEDKSPSSVEILQIK